MLSFIKCILKEEIKENVLRVVQIRYEYNIDRSYWRKILWTLYKYNLFNGTLYIPIHLLPYKIIQKLLPNLANSIKGKPKETHKVESCKCIL